MLTPPVPSSFPPNPFLQAWLTVRAHNPCARAHGVRRWTANGSSTEKQPNALAARLRPFDTGDPRQMAEEARQ